MAITSCADASARTTAGLVLTLFFAIITLSQLAQSRPASELQENAVVARNSSGACWLGYKSDVPATWNDTSDEALDGGLGNGDENQSQRMHKRNEKPPIYDFIWRDSQNRFQSCPLRGAGVAHVQAPNYPGIHAIEDREFWPDAQFWYLPKRKTFSDHECVYTTISKAERWEFVNKIVPPRQYPYLFGGEHTDMTIDHVYEVSILKNFFEYALENEQITCQQLNDWFMQPDSRNRAGGLNRQPPVRLQSFFNLLGSYDWPDLAGVEKTVNVYKGYIFGPGKVWKPNGCLGKNAPSNVPNEARVQCIYDMSLALEYTNFVDVAFLFSMTNSRIAAAMKGLDELIHNNGYTDAELQAVEAHLAAGGEPQYPDRPPPTLASGLGWAAFYQSYMYDYLDALNDDLAQMFAEFQHDDFLLPMDPGPQSDAVHAGRQQWLDYYDTQYEGPPSINTEDLFGPAPFAAAHRYKWYIGKRGDGHGDGSSSSTGPVTDAANNTPTESTRAPGTPARTPSPSAPTHVADAGRGDGGKSTAEARRPRISMPPRLPADLRKHKPRARGL